MSFELFDPRGEVYIREGKLPHWYQPGVTYFVTFRTDDSVPQVLLRSWHARREVWLRRRGLDPAQPSRKAKPRQLPEVEREYNATVTREYMEYLDRGYRAGAAR